MKITLTNELLGVTPTVSVGASTDLAENVTDQDFSVFYTGSSASTLTFDFGAVLQINYIAVAGINIEGDRSGTSRVRVYDGAVLKRTINITSNRPVVFHLEELTSFANLRVELFQVSGVSNPSVNFIAAGVYWDVPNSGETSGYDRQYLKRDYTNVSTTNKQVAPIGLLRKKQQTRGSLNLPNVTSLFCDTTLDDFFIFSQENLFFISERDDEIISPSAGSAPTSYMCYDIERIKVSAHPQTRSLNNVNFRFKVFNGL